MTKAITETRLRSFVHNVDIFQAELDDGSFNTIVQIYCENDYQVRRVLKKHQRIAFYNTYLGHYPKNEWLIFEVYQGKSNTDSHQLIGIHQSLRGEYVIPYRFKASQKNEPNPRQITLLRSLALIL